MAKVFLTAGHGGPDPGAVAYNMKEKDINLQTMLACKDVLEAHGVTVICSRTTDENDGVRDEVKEANASGADLAFSIHTNAGGGDGFEAFYHTSNTEGKKLAQLAEKHVKTLGQNSRGVKSGNHLYFIKNTKMLAVLVENFFIDNDTDNNIGDTIAEQKAFGVAYAKAILEYFGIAYGAKPTTTETNASFKVRVSITNLNIRKGPGTNYATTGKIKPTVYTIVETKSGKGSAAGWGKLKSGAGWISLDYVTRL